MGNPLIENGMISAYSTLDNTSSLTIGNNGITTGKVLDLVAPAINADGEIRAAALNVITGTIPFPLICRLFPPGKRGSAGQLLSGRHARR